MPERETGWGTCLGARGGGGGRPGGCVAAAGCSRGWGRPGGTWKGDVVHGVFVVSGVNLEELGALGTLGRALCWVVLLESGEKGGVGGQGEWLRVRRRQWGGPALHSVPFVGCSITWGCQTLRKRNCPGTDTLGSLLCPSCPASFHPVPTQGSALGTWGTQGAEGCGMLMDVGC